MAHWCRICDTFKANERFSGKGHRDHICKACSRRPIAERDAIDQQREISGYFNQRNISKKNLKRLSVLIESPNPHISDLASVVLSVGLAKPHRRKRIAFLARDHQHILEKLGDVGLITPPSEYLSGFYHDDHCDCSCCTIVRFDNEMDKLRESDNMIEPGQVERILQELAEMVGDKT